MGCRPGADSDKGSNKRQMRALVTPEHLREKKSGEREGGPNRGLQNPAPVGMPEIRYPK